MTPPMAMLERFALVLGRAPADGAGMFRWRLVHLVGRQQLVAL